MFSDTEKKASTDYDMRRAPGPRPGNANLSRLSLLMFPSHVMSEGTL